MINVLLLLVQTVMSVRRNAYLDRMRRVEAERLVDLLHGQALGLGEEEDGEQAERRNKDRSDPARTEAKS